MRESHDVSLRHSVRVARSIPNGPHLVYHRHNWRDDPIRTGYRAMRASVAGYAISMAVLVVLVSIAGLKPVRGEPNCTCRYAGLSFALNTCACLSTPSGVQRACCNMVLNNTSWEFTGDPCPLAAVPNRIPTSDVADHAQGAQELIAQLNGLRLADTAASGM
jgi:hypothetical protein